MTSTLRSLSVVTVFSALLALTPIHSAAQFGIRGGVNLSRFVGGDTESDPRAGINLGASIPLLRIGPLALVPEVYYSAKGGTALPNFGLTPVTATPLEFELSYLEVPLLLRLHFPLGPIEGYVGGGPAYAWNLDCKFTAESDPNAVSQECGQPFQSFDTAMSSADKLVVVNGGLNLFVLGGFGGLNLDARWVRGFDRVIEGEDATGDTDAKNQSITLMLGYFLGR
jgi:hypothetical protein